MPKKDVTHSRVRELKCYDDVIALIRAGANPSAIARYVQEDAREMLDVKRRSAEMAVRRFISDAPPGLVLTPDLVVAKTIDLKTKAPPSYVEKMREQMEEGLDVLAEKERLYYVQKERLMRMIEHEKEVPPVSLKSIRYEIELADKMLTELGKFQMDLGVVKRVPMAADIRMLQRAEVDVGRNMLQVLMAKGLDVEGILGGGVVDAESVKLLTEPEAMKRVLREGLIDGADEQD